MNGDLNATILMPSFNNSITADVQTSDVNENFSPVNVGP
jgi:hypothetical protein